LVIEGLAATSAIRYPPRMASDPLIDSEGAVPAALYLDLLKRCLTGSLWLHEYRRVAPRARWKRKLYLALTAAVKSRGLEVVRRIPIDVEKRRKGLDWPEHAETMIGMQRMDNLQFCVTDVLRRGVPGDLIETGVWRGGAVILMRGVLKAYGDAQRRVWVADSFQGLPRPDPQRFPSDAGDRHWTIPDLAASLDEVRDNFARYGLLDHQVQFLPGWFRDTLPTAPIEQLAVLRLDGDMYESTMVALTCLVPKLMPGGYVIIDDYGALPNCRAAVDDYRSEHGIKEPLERIDWTGVYWRSGE
jgi:O-methyltransferase